MRLVWLLLAAAPLTASLGAAPVELSLKRAVQLAVSPEGNTRVQLSGEALKQAQSKSLQSRASLLPDLSAAYTEQNLTRNLGALGIHLASPFPGFQIPQFVGPFTTLDGRVTATQSVFDISAYRRYQALKAAVGAPPGDLKAAGHPTPAR